MSLLLLSLLACSTPDAAPGPRADDVVFIVLDNVRADRTSLCGSSRPTTPNLEALAAKGNHSCGAVAPGAWTLPSHASYFTGVEVPEHGAHFSAEAGKLAPQLMLQAYPLGDSPETLAEHFAEQGFETTLVSANPVLGDASGLTRGYENTRVAMGFVKWYGRPVVEQVSQALQARDTKRPLFLTVNIADAHTPWKAVPRGIGFIPPRPRPNVKKSSRTDVSVRLVNGELSEAHAKAFSEHLTDAYDYGVYRADATLGQVLELLDQHGVKGRLIVTSDHGEYLGEHQMLSHCCAPFEENVTVPLVVTGIDGLDLPERLGGVAVHDLVQRGELVEHPVRTYAAPNPSWFDRSETFGRDRWVAEYDGSRKVYLKNGTSLTTDLTQDPSEQELTPTEAPAELQQADMRFHASTAREAQDEDLGSALKELGYVE